MHAEVDVWGLSSWDSLRKGSSAFLCIVLFGIVFLHYVNLQFLCLEQLPCGDVSRVCTNGHGVLGAEVGVSLASPR